MKFQIFSCPPLLKCKTLKCQRFLLPNFLSRDLLSRWLALETTGPFQSMCISSSNADWFALRSGFICFCSIDPLLSTTASLGVLHKSLRASFQTVQTVSRLSRQFPDCPDSLQTVRTAYRHLQLTDTFYTVQLVARLSVLKNSE